MAHQTDTYEVTTHWLCHSQQLYFPPGRLRDPSSLQTRYPISVAPTSTPRVRRPSIAACQEVSIVALAAPSAGAHGALVCARMCAAVRRACESNSSASPGLNRECTMRRPRSRCNSESVACRSRCSSLTPFNALPIWLNLPRGAGGGTCLNADLAWKQGAGATEVRALQLRAGNVSLYTKDQERMIMNEQEQSDMADL